MLFKEFLLEGRPFYDEQGNKYVASKNDHYSKNGEEISKQEYDRVVHEIKNKKETSKNNKLKTPVKEIKKNTEKNEKYLQELLPDAVIGFKSTAKNKERVKQVTECVDGLLIKYPKLKDYMSNSFIGDYSVLSKRLDEINDKSSKDHRDLSKEEIEGFKQSADINFTIDYDIYKNSNHPVKYFLLRMLSENDVDDFLLDNHINGEDKISIFEDETLVKALKQALINKRIKDNLTINQNYLPNPIKYKVGGYFIPSQRSHLRGVVINQKIINDGYDIDDEPESYENYHINDGNSRTLKYIITHEMGHSVDSALDLSKNLEIQHLYYDNLEKLPDEVSLYSVTNIKEFIAECFAEYHLSSNPNEIPKRVGEIIDKLMGEK